MWRSKELAAALLLSLVAARTPADDGGTHGPTDGDVVGCGIYRTLHSAVLGEDRTLLIRLPLGYGGSNKRYPVLFKLDGERSVFLQTAAVVEYLVETAEAAGVPDHIVVGIVNTDRQRDMDPERGAAGFARFVETELVPFVDHAYRTDGRRILAAQSFSTLCAVHVLLTRPGVFGGYILSSFGIHKETIARRFEEALTRSLAPQSAGKGLVFVAYGKRDASDPDGSITRRGADFLGRLEHAWSPGLRLISRTYEDEGHVPFPAVYDGLRWIYDQTDRR